MQLAPVIDVPRETSRKLHQWSFLVALLFAVLGLFVFYPLLQAGFINLDDPYYVTRNPMVQKGLTKDGILWAFTTTHAHNWHPITWLSHMLDCEWHGLNAKGHHLTSVLLHIINSVLLFYFLAGATAFPPGALLVGLLFLLHPMNVESVAWVSERKNVLSTFFLLLALLVYTRHVMEPSERKKTLVFSLLLLGLMSKPMLVSAPFILLLLDYWPFRRFPSAEVKASSSSSMPKLIFEKWPFLLLTVVFCIITLQTQGRGGAIIPEARFTVSERAANAAVSYASYLGKLLWPDKLSIYYPMQSLDGSTGMVVMAFMGVIALGVSAILVHRTAPYAITGIFWFLGTMVPVIGMVQVGGQAMADRYAYVPFIGGFVVIVWTFLYLQFKVNRQLVRIAGLIFFCIYLMVLGMKTRAYSSMWHDSEVLFANALRNTRNNAMAHTCLGMALSSAGKYKESVEQYRLAEMLLPKDPEIPYLMGVAEMKAGNMAEARSAFYRSLEWRPGYAEAWNNLGVIFAQEGDGAQAIRCLEKAIESKPDYAEALENLQFLQRNADTSNR